MPFRFILICDAKTEWLVSPEQFCHVRVIISSGMLICEGAQDIDLYWTRFRHSLVKARKARAEAVRDAVVAVMAEFL